jgi:hypothetical protein
MEFDIIISKSKVYQILQQCLRLSSHTYIFSFGIICMSDKVAIVFQQYVKYKQKAIILLFGIVVTV